jgi:tetratricopeptide (TPR) repeat protein
MPRQPASTDIIYRDPLDSFTDREAILNLFEQSLRAIQPGQLRVLAIKGNSGTGKTFLISYLTGRACPRLNWQSGQLSFAQSTPDFRSILMGIEDALKNCVPRESLKRYREKRDEYNRRFDEYRASIIIAPNVEASNQSSISNVSQSVQVNAQLRERELHLRSELTRALVELSEESTSPLCLFIDGYERLAEGDPELDGWLWEEILPELAKVSPQPLLVVTCGWERPANAAIKPLSYSTELHDFDLAQVRSYLEKQEVITDTVEPNSQGQEELVSAFYELTKGHPLVLGLAVTYFKQLDSHERTAQSLRTNRPLVDEQARVEFLEDRLLNRLPEPYRTLLERGPILRHFDHAALHALLDVEAGSEATTVTRLDDRSYDRFLRYPFINQGGESLAPQPTFHDLVRQVRLQALRHHHPDTKEQLHRKMVDYYDEILQAGRGTSSIEISPEDTGADNPSKADYAGWLAEIPEKEFGALLEKLYHALQVTELQEDAFEEWEELAGRAVNRWRHRQAGPILELVRQLAEEGEPFLNKTSNLYGQYLVWYSRFLEQESRWKEARDKLVEAVRVFEALGNLSARAVCLNNIGMIYDSQGKLEEALSYQERSLALREQVGNPADIATSLNNIGTIYYNERALDEALNYFERALTLFELVGNPTDIATSLNNIGEIYRQQGKLEEALGYHERALALREQVGNPADIATSLNNIGSIYHHQGKLEEALSYYERALAYDEQVGNPTDIATSLNNIGDVYQERGKLEEALSYYERSLALKEQVGNPADIALSLHNIGGIDRQQEKWEQAIEQYSKALGLYEDLGLGFESDVADELEALAICYAELGDFEKALPYYARAQQMGRFTKKD